MNLDGAPGHRKIKLTLQDRGRQANPRHGCQSLQAIPQIPPAPPVRTQTVNSRVGFADRPMAFRIDFAHLFIPIGVNSRNFRAAWPPC